MEQSKSPVSATSMEKFVRKLFQETKDLDTLTQRIVRQKYMQYIKVSSIDVEEKALLKQIVQLYVEELRQKQQTSEDAATDVQDDKENGEVDMVETLHQKKTAKSPDPKSQDPQRSVQQTSRAPLTPSKSRSPRVASSTPDTKKSNKKRWLSAEQAREALMRTPSKSPLKTQCDTPQATSVKPESPATQAATAEPEEEQKDTSLGSSGGRKKKWQRVSSSEVREALMASDAGLSGVSELDNDIDSDSDNDDGDTELTSPAKKTPQKSKQKERDEENWKPFTPVKDLSHSDGEGSEAGRHSEADSGSDSGSELEELDLPKDEPEAVDSPIQPTKRHRQSKASQKVTIISDSEEEEEEPVNKSTKKSATRGTRQSPKGGARKKLKLKGPKSKRKAREDEESSCNVLDDTKLNVSCVVDLVRCSDEEPAEQESDIISDEDMTASWGKKTMSMKKGKKSSLQRKRKRCAASSLSTECEPENLKKAQKKKPASKRQRREASPVTIDSSDDEPAARKPPARKKKSTVKASLKDNIVIDSDSEEEMPLAAMGQRSKKNTKGRTPQKKTADSDTDEDSVVGSASDKSSVESSASDSETSPRKLKKSPSRKEKRRSSAGEKTKKALPRKKGRAVKANSSASSKRPQKTVSRDSSDTSSEEEEEKTRNRSSASAHDTDSSSDASSDLDISSLKKKTPAKSVSRNSSGSSSASGSSSDSDDALLKKKSPPTAVDSSSESSSGEDASPLKKTPPRRATDNSSDSSSDDGVPLKKKKSPPNKKRKRSSSGEQQTKAKRQKASDKKDDVMDASTKRLKHLERIARAGGVMPCGRQITVMYADCNNTNQRIRKIKQVLEEAGMKGRPDLKKAEQLKLKREAQELDTGNIISSQGRGRRRNVFSMYATQEIVAPSPDKTQQGQSARSAFSRLRGIVDSDSDSDTD